MPTIPVRDLTGAYAIHQGSDYDESFQMLDADSVPVDLTGLALEAQARSNYADLTPVVVFTFAASVVNPTQGIFRLQLTNAVTAANQSVFEGKWDLEATDGVTRKRQCQGAWSMTREVTRP